MAAQATATARIADAGLATIDAAIPKHIPTLDGLRGVAILLVILHHLAKSLQLEFTPGNATVTWLLNAFVLGWSGVDLFFVLSGFLITGILVDTKGTPHFLSNFYVRRALRIFPLYFGVLTCAALIAMLVPSVRHWFGTEDLWWQFVYATNINITLNGWRSVGWFGHFWSLAIEEHFYLLWPLVVLLCRTRTLIVITASIWVAVFLVRWGVLHLYYPTPATYVLTPLRIDSLALGSCLAILVRNQTARDWLASLAPRVTWVAGVLIGAMVLAAGSVSHENYWLQGAGFSLFGICYASLLLQGVFPRRAQWASRMLVNPMLRSAGKYSYGLYVFHVPVFMFFFHSHKGDQLRAILTGGNAGGWLDACLTTLLALAISIAVALLSWTVWEKQFLKKKIHFQ